MLSPYRPIAESVNYMVRAKPGRRDSVMGRAEARLAELDGDRVFESKSMSQVRADAYRGDHGLVVLLVSVCVALLIVTAFGIVGLTSYWVAQRRQQIGIRRALGATRHAIMSYFQTENFMIAAAGCSTGIAFAIALNLWMVQSFEIVRMENSRAIAGAMSCCYWASLRCYGRRCAPPRFRRRWRRAAASETRCESRGNR